MLFQHDTFDTKFTPAFGSLTQYLGIVVLSVHNESRHSRRATHHTLTTRFRRSDRTITKELAMLIELSA
jgi:hypothetical protein